MEKLACESDQGCEVPSKVGSPQRQRGRRVHRVCDRGAQDRETHGDVFCHIASICMGLSNLCRSVASTRAFSLWTKRGVLALVPMGLLRARFSL